MRIAGSGYSYEAIGNPLPEWVGKWFWRVVMSVVYVGWFMFGLGLSYMGHWIVGGIMLAYEIGGIIWALKSR